MSLRYVCGIIKDRCGRYLTLDYTPTSGASLKKSTNKCTISVESWVGQHEDTFDALVNEINTTLSIPTLEILSSLNLRDTKSLRRFGTNCEQNLSVFTFTMDDIFRSKCSDEIRQRFLTADQIQQAIRTKEVVPTTYCRFVVDRMHLWERIT